MQEPDHELTIEEIDKQLEKAEGEIQASMQREQDRGKYLALQFIKTFDPLKLCEDFYIINPYFFDLNQIFWLWNHDTAIYERVDDITILNTINQAFDLINTTSPHFISNVMNGLKMVGRKNIPPNPPENWVQYGKIIWDVKNLKEFPATPEYFHANSLPYEPSDNPETPTIDKIFKQWVGDKGELGNVRTLYEIIAYCTYRAYPLHHIFCFIGAGSNGKSKYLQLLRKFIGINNCCSTELDTLMNSRFEASSLYKKLACMMGETNFGTMSKTSMLKKLSGEDLISFEFKGKNPFPDVSYAKILISTNTLPETTDKTHGFYRRWIIIDFPNKFSGDTDILDEIPEQEFNNLARKCANYLHDLLFIRQFSNVGDVEYRKNLYEDKSNPLKKFLDLFTEENVEGIIPKYEFRDKFGSWCLENNLRQRNDAEIGIRMKEHFEDKRLYVERNGEEKHIWCWVGLRWREITNTQTSEENVTQ